MTGIYQIINKIDGKRYIGSTVDIERRWSWHKSRLNKDKHYNLHLQRAWNKYGDENFEFRLIEEILEKSLLLTIEQLYLDSLNPEYNMSPTAGGGDQGEEARRKISLASKGNKANLGKRFSNDHKQKISDAHVGKRKGMRAAPETKLKMSQARSGEKHWNFGKHHSLEIKMKISNTLKSKIKESI